MRSGAGVTRIADCIFEGNKADGGGAVTAWERQADVVIIGCTFHGNSAGGTAKEVHMPDLSMLQLCLRN